MIFSSITRRGFQHMISHGRHTPNRGIVTTSIITAPLTSPPPPPPPSSRRMMSTMTTTTTTTPSRTMPSSHPTFPSQPGCNHFFSSQANVSEYDDKKQLIRHFKAVDKRRTMGKYNKEHTKKKYKKKKNYKTLDIHQNPQEVLTMRLKHFMKQGSWSSIAALCAQGSLDMDNCNRVLEACHSSEHCRVMLEQMKIGGVNPNVDSFAILMGTLMLEGEYDGAANVLNEMKRKRIRPRQSSSLDDDQEDSFASRAAGTGSSDVYNYARSSTSTVGRGRSNFRKAMNRKQHIGPIDDTMDILNWSDKDISHKRVEKLEQVRYCTDVSMMSCRQSYFTV